MFKFMRSQFPIKRPFTALQYQKSKPLTAKNLTDHFLRHS